MAGASEQGPGLLLVLDQETAALSQNPQFLAIMERSRIRYAQEGGISSADMRNRLELAPKQDDSAAAG